MVLHLVRIDKELSEADIESLQILTEGFVNNCFKKKLKFFLSNLSENLANTSKNKSSNLISFSGNNEVTYHSKNSTSVLFSKPQTYPQFGFLR
jgi:hypothetical protein